MIFSLLDLLWMTIWVLSADSSAKDMRNMKFDAMVMPHSYFCYVYTVSVSSLSRSYVVFSFFKFSTFIFSLSTCGTALCRMGTKCNLALVIKRLEKKEFYSETTISMTFWQTHVDQMLSLITCF